MKHRPFSELTKHWPPERKARVEARVAAALAELDRQRVDERGRVRHDDRRDTRHPAAGGEGGTPRM